MEHKMLRYTAGFLPKGGFRHPFRENGWRLDETLRPCCRVVQPEASQWQGRKKIMTIAHLYIAQNPCLLVFQDLFLYPERE